MAITLADFNKIWASTSPLTPYSFSDNNYKQGWNFVGGTPPARQMWDSYMKFSDEKQQYIVNNFLPLSGGTMTNDISTSYQYFALKSTYTNNAGGVTLRGGTNYADGSSLTVYGKNHSSLAGQFNIIANDGINAKTLNGRPDGTFTWDGKRVHNGNATSVWSYFTPTEAQYGAVFLDIGFGVFCCLWIGANVTRSAGTLLFTVDSEHLPGYDIRVPFVYNTGSTVGVVKIEASTGKATVESISDTSAQGRLTIGGFMWVKVTSLW